jgi:hypothetical protein
MFRLLREGIRAVCRVSAVGALLALSMAVSAPSASAGPGYELDPVSPSIALTGEIAHGLAVDQTSQNLYVTELSTDAFSAASGYIQQFDSNGVPTAASPFSAGAESYPTGVAVNPMTHGIFSYQTRLSTPSGEFGTSKMNTFSSAGVAGTSFSTAQSTAAQIAADGTGRVYFPNDTGANVEIFSSTGTLAATLTCAGCSGGVFVQPASVALDSAGNLYVVDLANGGRVVKLHSSGGSYTYDSVLQSGAGAAAVGVDPLTNDVFVGDYAEGTYHVIAYDSSGTQFDDFGSGFSGVTSFGAVSAGQLAANATTHKLYLSDPNNDKVWVFDRISSIPAPTAATTPASSLGQLGATLNANTNPKGHGLSDCHFEYTDDADFDANAFAHAISKPCPSKPAGSTSTPVSAQIKSLIPATAYDYRIVVTSSGGTTEGAAQTFETLPALAPAATTNSASPVGQTTATLGGSVNPLGGPTSDCHFEYISETDFQKNGFIGALSKACQVKPEGTTNTPVSANIAGLTPATAYRFRVVATNNSGTTKATDQTFSTPAETCDTNPALCPPPPVEQKTTPPPTPQPPAPTTPAKKPLKCRKGFKKTKVHGKAKCVKIKKKHH